jgi:hypothetical protein
MNTFEMPFDLSRDALFFAPSEWERDMLPSRDFSDLESILANDARKALKRANFDVDPKCQVFTEVRETFRAALPETRLAWLKRHVPSCSCCRAATKKARTAIIPEDEFLESTEGDFLPEQKNLFNPMPMGVLEDMGL